MTATVPNPFTPAFGRVPPILVGRQPLVTEMRRAFDSPGGDPALCTILVGPRGSGKTALISYLSLEAQQRGWVTANATALPGLLDDLLFETRKAASEFLSTKAAPRVKSLSVSHVVGVEFEPSKKSGGNWRSSIGEILDELEELDIGLLLAVDEVVSDSDELREVAAAFQHFVREERKVGLLMAGLPANVSALLQDRSVSFLLRANQRELERVADAEIRDALLETFRATKVTIEPEAADTLAAAIDGFPYLLQLIGFHAWELARSTKNVDAEAARIAARTGRRDYFNGVLRRTYAALSEQDRAFLHAMTLAPGPSSISAISERMGKSPSYARVYRQRLVEQGVITRAGRGSVAFALPGMREFLEEYGD